MRFESWMAGAGMGALACVVAAACGGETDRDTSPGTAPDCPPGSEGCVCGEQTSCEQGLDCVSGLCRRAASPETNGESVEEFPCANLSEVAAVACAWQHWEWEHLQSNILLVVDGSASLADVVDASGTTRWDLVRSSLIQVLEEGFNVYEFGLLLYPVSVPGQPFPDLCDGAPAQCCGVTAAGTMTIGIMPGEPTAQAIVEALQARSPIGASPTAAALARAYDYLEGASLDGHTYVLLATDGGANCNQALTCEESMCTLELDASESCLAVSNTCCRAGPGGCLDEAEVTAQLERLREAGIETIVAGVADHEPYVAALNRWAEAGGFAREDGGYLYYDLSTEAGQRDLAATFRPITQTLSDSCELPLDEARIGDLTDAVVAINCEPLEYHSQVDGTEPSGWHYNNPEAPTSIILDGASCEAVSNERQGRIDALFECPRGGID